MLVVDAMTDRDAAAHRHSVEKLFPRETDVTENVLNLVRSGATAYMINSSLRRAMGCCISSKSFFTMLRP